MNGNVIGGLIAENSGTLTMTNTIWDTETSGVTTSVGGGVGKTTIEMKTKATYEALGWDFVNTWEMVEGSYPTLKSNPETPLPVELTTFSANIISKKVELSWSKATEVNNYGFEIQRQTEETSIKNHEEPFIPSGDEGWRNIGFVQGSGNSNSTKIYSFSDNKIEQAGKYFYRLKQIDIDGKYEYSDIIEVEVVAPTSFSLSQNYPNPFNPTTTINYTIPNNVETLYATSVQLIVYDVLGKEVTTLVNENQEAGNYKVNFDGSNLSSGVYFYQLKANGNSNIKRMILAK